MKVCPDCQRCFEDESASCSQKEHGPLVFKRAGTRVINNRYRLDRLLGHGGMGAVYRCTHMALDHEMAVKLLLPDSAEADPYGRQRLRREGLTACRFNHPNLVRVHDCGTNGVVVEEEGGAQRYDELYVVMELLNGYTLREHLRQAGPLPSGRAVSIAHQVALGLAAIHSKGIVHRDLKPENVMITRDYKGDMLVKIVDFGAVKFISGDAAPDDVDLTGTMMIGSARYTSPENCRGEPLDERSDIYCLGLILYEMLAGHHPFKARDWADLVYQHAYIVPPPLDEICGNVPTPLTRLMTSSLAKFPKDRPQSATEFARVLLDFLSPGAEENSRWNVQGGLTPGPESSDAKESPADEETRVAGRLVDETVITVASATQSVSATTKVPYKSALDSIPPRRREAKRVAFGLTYFIAFLVAIAFFTHSFLSRGPSANGAAVTAARETTPPAPNSEVGDELLAATDINIRDAPSLKGTRVGLAEKGSKVRVISKNGNWREVVVLTHARPKKDETSEDQGWLDGALLKTPE